MKSQENEILEYMIRHGSITQLEAMRDLGCMRLGARVFDLKERGVPVAKVMETS